MSTRSLPPNDLGAMFGKEDDPLRNMTGEDFAALLGLSKARTLQSESAIISGRPRLAEQALHGPAGNIVRTIEPHSEADTAAILLQFLAAFGNIIGPGPHCTVEATRHGLNVFVVLVGDSSKARKGTSWGHIRRLFHRVEAEWVANRVTGGLSSAEGLINEVRDEEAATDRRLMAVSDEFASVLKVMSREGNTLSPLLRSAWDSGDLKTLVKTNPLKATGAHISLIGHITQTELLKFLNGTEANNGFGNRLLWIWVTRSKFLPEGGAVPEQEMSALSIQVREAVQWAKNEREFRRDHTSRQLWATVYPELSRGQPGLLGAVTSRAEAQVLQLSAIYAALDQSAVIRVEHLWAALSLWDYCFASARYIFGDATGDPNADRIRDSLNAAGANGMNKTDLHAIFKRHISGDALDRAVKQLESMGIARRETMRSEGRSMEMWFAN